MKSLLVAFIALIGATAGANAQCATGYTQLNNVFVCQPNGGAPFNVGNASTQAPNYAFTFSSANTQTFAEGSFTMPQAGALQSLSIFLASGTAAGPCFLGAYDNTGSGGKPGALLGKTALTSMIAGWNTVATTTHPSMTNGQVVYFAVLCPSPNGVSINYGGPTLNNNFYDVPGDSTLPTTYTTPYNPVQTNMWSIYGTFQ